MQLITLFLMHNGIYIIYKVYFLVHKLNLYPLRNNTTYYKVFAECEYSAGFSCGTDLFCISIQQY